MATIRTRFGNVNFVDGSTVGAKVNTKVETTLPTSFNFVSTVSNPDGDTQRIQAISYSSTSIKDGLSQYFLTSYNPEGQYKLDFNYNTGYLGLKRVTDIADATNAGKIALEPEIQDWVQRGVHEMIMRTNTDMQVGSSYLPLILYSSDIPHYYHKKILEDNTTEIIDKPIALAEDVSTLKDQVLALSGGTMTGNINYQFGNESATTGIYWNMPGDAAAIYTEGVPDDSTNLIFKVSNNDTDNIKMIYSDWRDGLDHDILVANGQRITAYKDLYEGDNRVATQAGMKSSGSSKYAYYIYDSNVPTDPISIRYHGPGAGIDYVTGFAGYHQTKEGTNNSIVPVQKSEIINWIKTTRSTLTISQGALKTAYNGNEDKSISIGNPSAINNVTYTKNPNTEATSAGENVTLIDNGRISGGKAQKIYPKTKASLIENDFFPSQESLFTICSPHDSIIKAFPQPGIYYVGLICNGFGQFDEELSLPYTLQIGYTMVSNIFSSVFIYDASFSNLNVATDYNDSTIYIRLSGGLYDDLIHVEQSTDLINGIDLQKDDAQIYVHSLFI